MSVTWNDVVCRQWTTVEHWQYNCAIVVDVGCKDQAGYTNTIWPASPKKNWTIDWKNWTLPRKAYRHYHFGWFTIGSMLTLSLRFGLKKCWQVKSISRIKYCLMLWYNIACMFFLNLCSNISYTSLIFVGKKLLLLSLWYVFKKLNVYGYWDYGVLCIPLNIFCVLML